MKKSTRVRVVGPLAAQVDGFGAALEARGYKPATVVSHLLLMAHVSRWLSRRHWQSGELTSGRITKFLKRRRREGYRTMLTERGIAPLLDHLRGLEVVPRPARVVAHTRLELLLEHYGDYLSRERGLNHRSATCNRAILRRAMGTYAARRGAKAGLIVLRAS